MGKGLGWVRFRGKSNDFGIGFGFGYKGLGLGFGVLPFRGRNKGAATYFKKGHEV